MSQPNRRPGLIGLAVVFAATLAACDGTTEPEPEPALIEVTSAVDRIIDLDRTAQLTAVVKDASGAVMSEPITWVSGSPTVATVSGTGLVTAVSTGEATISATAGAVTGMLAMEVVDADLEAIEAALGDPLVNHLTGPLGPSKTDIDAALAECDEALGSGNLVQLDGCLETVRTTAASATAADDRALLAVLTLLTDHATRKLNL